MDPRELHELLDISPATINSDADENFMREEQDCSPLIPPTGPYDWTSYNADLGSTIKPVLNDEDPQKCLCNINQDGNALSSAIDPVANELVDLFQSYSKSSSALTHNHPSTAASEIDTEASSVTEPSIAMSKAQHTLAEAEEYLWNGFLWNSKAQVDMSLLSTIQARSNAFIDMFRKRKPPSFEIYKECKQLLRALGVPCLDSPPFTEGEAYAASLVHNGYGDYVASEDSVSALYPHLQALTNLSI